VKIVLQALLEAGGAVAKALTDSGVTADGLTQAVAAVRGGEGVNSADAEESRQALEKYTIDLTERARDGKLDPVIGRDDEIRPHHPGVAASDQKTTPSSSVNPALVRPP
jgi:ATP-dependent Clp protease ATP-binding subunit ClpB